MKIIDVLKSGHTNESFIVKKNNKKYFKQVKMNDTFNHLIDYKVLKKLDFVPRLYENNKEALIWEYIENIPFKFKENEIRQVARNLKTLHSSKMIFPKSNYIDRLKQYMSMVKKNNKSPIPEVEKFKDKAYKIAKSLKNDCPCHNDIWVNNIILDKNKKMYFIDWEYASFGDKHYDIAYFINSLNAEKWVEEVFLDEYKEFDYDKLKDAKMFVDYLTIIWLERNETWPFDGKDIIDRINKY